MACFIFCRLLDQLADNTIPLSKLFDYQQFEEPLKSSNGSGHKILDILEVNLPYLRAATVVGSQRMIYLKLAMMGLTELAGKQQLLVLSNGSDYSQQATLENRTPLVDLISSTSSETDVVVSFEGKHYFQRTF